MKPLFEDRSTYAPATDAVAVVSFTVECSPGQANAVLDFLAQVRDCAGVYSVDFETDVRIPQAQPVLEIVTLAELVDLALPVDFIEGEVHGEQAIQQPSDDAQAAEVGSGTVDVGGSGESESVGDAVAPVVAEPSGEVGAGSVERSA